MFIVMKLSLKMCPLASLIMSRTCKGTYLFLLFNIHETAPSRTLAAYFALLRSHEVLYIRRLGRRWMSKIDGCLAALVDERLRSAPSQGSGLNCLCRCSVTAPPDSHLLIAGSVVAMRVPSHDVKIIHLLAFSTILRGRADSPVLALHTHFAD